MDKIPPIYTLTEELVDWTLGRTADIPKSQRFTLGQRLDNLTLDALLSVVKARYSKPPQRQAHLRSLNLILEQLRVLWRIVQKRGWVSQQQLLHVNGRIDEIGRMAGGWMKESRRV